MHIDELRFAFGLPLESAILEVADELFLLRVDGDHGYAAADAMLSLGVDVLELGVTIRVLGAFDGFLGRLEAVALLAQKLGDGLVADSKPVLLETAPSTAPPCSCRHYELQPSDDVKTWFDFAADFGLDAVALLADDVPGADAVPTPARPLPWMGGQKQGATRTVFPARRSREPDNKPGKNAP